MKNSVLKISLDPEALGLVSRAAQIHNVSVEDFAVSSAIACARFEIAEQQLFDLEQEDLDLLAKKLSSLPKLNERVKNLLDTKAPWEE